MLIEEIKIKIKKERGVYLADVFRGGKVYSFEDESLHNVYEAIGGLLINSDE